MGCCRHFDYRIGTSRRFLLIPQPLRNYCRGNFFLQNLSLRSMHLDCLGMCGSKKRNTRFHKCLLHLDLSRVESPGGEGGRDTSLLSRHLGGGWWVPEWQDDQNLTCQNWRGVKNHLLALPFISGVTSCWSRVERDGRQETRWEL